MVLLSNRMFSKSYFQNCFPEYYCVDDVCRNTASDSNTKTVLLSEAVFFKDIPKWYYFRNYCFQTNILRMVFQCIIKLTMSLKTLLLTVIPKRYYYQSIVFKEIPKWYYILSYCFQCNIFKIVFRCIFKLTSVCQNSVSDSNTKTVLLSEAVFFKEILKWFYFQI